MSSPSSTTNILPLLILFTLFAQCVSAIPSLTPLFNINVNVGAASQPVPIPGGQQIAIPILNGTLTGEVNGTILGGLAFLALYGQDENATQVPALTFYGQSSAGDGILVQEGGVTGPQGGFTRIQVTAGGSYTNLFSAFLVCEVLNRTETQVNSACYQLHPGV